MSLTIGGEMDFKELKEIAISKLNPKKYTDDIEAGGVAAAILTDKGNVYTGVCIDTACSMGFCAEHAAIAAMITEGESRIEKVVAVNWDKHAMPPCGRCREFMAQLGNDNAEVMVTDDTVVKLKELLPYYWREFSN